MGTSIYWHILVNPEPSEGLKIRRGAIIITRSFDEQILPLIQEVATMNFGIVPIEKVRALSG